MENKRTRVSQEELREFVKQMRESNEILLKAVSDIENNLKVKDYILSQFLPRVKVLEQKVEYIKDQTGLGKIY